MEIVGWSMSDRLKGCFAIDAMRMALQNRRPPPGLICHSDRGVQYACADYRRLLKAQGARASMSGKGNCLDNAPMESFFGSLKTELVHRTRFASRREARPPSSSTLPSSTTAGVGTSSATARRNRLGST